MLLSHDDDATTSTGHAADLLFLLHKPRSDARIALRELLLASARRQLPPLSEVDWRRGAAFAGLSRARLPLVMLECNRVYLGGTNNCSVFNYYTGSNMTTFAN